MTDAFPRQNRTLVIGVQGRLCALPLTHVMEIMRPLPVEPIPAVPSFVQGISRPEGFRRPLLLILGVLLGDV